MRDLESFEVIVCLVFLVLFELMNFALLISLFRRDVSGSTRKGYLYLSLLFILQISNLIFIYYTLSIDIRIYL